MNQFQKDMRRFKADDQVKFLQRARLSLHKIGYDVLGYKVLVALKARLRDMNETAAVAAVRP